MGRFSPFRGGLPQEFSSNCVSLELCAEGLAVYSEGLGRPAFVPIAHRESLPDVVSLHFVEASNAMHAWPAAPGCHPSVVEQVRGANHVILGQLL